MVGAIQGYLHLDNPVWTEAKDPKTKGYTFRELVPTIPAQYRKLYPHIPKEICLAALSTERQIPKPPILVRVGGGRTTPVTLVAPPGTKLVFQNTDPFPHRLYGVGMKEFPPNDTAKGGRREWSVPGPGVFEIRDELAPSLRMWVVGEPNVATISYPSMKGEFVLDVDTPGTYEVQAYFSGQKVGPPQTVNVETRDIKLAPIPVASATKTEEKAE